MHALAYSFIAIQILVLVTQFPEIYWNCACLIVNSGGNEIQDDEEFADEEEDNDDNDDKKKKVKVVNYGKIATAIGTFQNNGITILPPDVNKSSFTFLPQEQTNSIIYGLRGITRVSSSLIQQIMHNRPYTSLNDFLQKNVTNKLQTLNLIKSGAFDAIENKPREQIMSDYLNSIADKKEKLTLQNMQMLINYELIPEEQSFFGKLFLFNKFLKTCKADIYYTLTPEAVNFIDKYFDIDTIDNGSLILQKTWDNIYKKAMEPMRQFLKAHQSEILKQLNDQLYKELADKYAIGNVSKWEMDSLSFYYHKHELANLQAQYDDFNDLPEEPIIDYSFDSKDGQPIKVYRLNHIIGTVIDKDKIRNTITLLTPTGVVNVKIYKNQFAQYDKQISVRDEDGIKHVIEPSWFKRGTLLMIQGIRRGQDFVPKKYRSSVYPVVSKIINIENDHAEFQYERLEVNN